MFGVRSRGLKLGLLVVVFALAASTTSRANEQPFAQWLEALRAEAIGKGISAQIVYRATDGIAPIPRIIELDRKQPESRVTMADYLDKRLSQQRISKGRELLARYRTQLDRVARRYGVQPRFIVALWGLETNYGSYTGGFSVVAALATLAYDGRRGAYFRKELLNALRILDEGHISVELMKGSWAGAMGQSQFMPSSFLTYAEDFNGDGRRDIWTSLPDIFASIANYLKGTGWRDDQTWGRPVRLGRGFSPSLASLKVEKPMSSWAALGLRKADGRPLPTRELMGSVIQPDGAGTQAYLTYGNFKRIMRWNRSTYFATSVGLLSDRIGWQ